MLHKMRRCKTFYAKDKEDIPVNSVTLLFVSLSVAICATVSTYVPDDGFDTVRTELKT